MKKLLVLLLVLGMAAPVMAAEWNFYGSARMSTFRTSDDPGGTTSSTDTTTWALQGNSRIGANVKTSDVIGGRFEYGSGPNLRILYGTWNFGSGQLLVGQSYTPTAAFYSNSVFDGDGDLLGVGQFYEGRKAMIQLKMGAFKLALVSPTANSTLGSSNEVDLPKIEASYKFKTDTFFVDVFGGYQTYDAITTTATGKDESVDSYVVGLGGGINMDAFYAKAAVSYGINLGDYGAYVPGNASLSQTTLADYDSDGDLDDSKALAYIAVLGFKASDMLTIEAGYGAQTYEPDVSGSQEDKAQQYYINAVINIAPGFFVVPEFGIIDRDSDLADQGDLTYFGAKWQINF